MRTGYFICCLLLSTVLVVASEPPASQPSVLTPIETLLAFREAIIAHDREKTLSFVADTDIDFRTKLVDSLDKVDPKSLFDPVEEKVDGDLAVVFNRFMNKQKIYFAAMPLIKTPDGWRLLYDLSGKADIAAEQLEKLKALVKEATQKAHEMADQANREN